MSTTPEPLSPEPGSGRSAIGSWLSGPSSLRAGRRTPGQRLGLPPEGINSVAGMGRRLAALLLDWLACLLLVRLFLPRIEYGSPGSSTATLAFFAVEVALFTWLVGASFGQRVVGIGVVRLDGTRAGLIPVLARTALLCLVIPVLIWDQDGRGLHDRSAGTVLVRTR